jgi:hypothetical protein
MKTQFDNVVISSMMLFIDHKLCSKGEAFTNYSGQIYPIQSNYYSYNTYALPFRQIIADSSISGANIMSGVYVGSTFTPVNTSNLVGINHYRGQAYFNGLASDTLSGRYSVKDFNIYLTNKPEEEILFETQYKVRPKIAQSLTGLADNVETIPSIFIKNNGSMNEPFAFGGIKNSMLDIRVIVIADNLYNLDAACSILRDTNNTFVHTIESSDLKLDNLGNFTSGYYDYNNIVNNKINSTDKLYIEEVRVSKVPNLGFNSSNYKNTLFTAFVDFTLRKIRDNLN